MRLPLRNVAARGCALVAVAALCAAGALVASGGAASAGSTTVTVDHFLCYHARVAGPGAPQGIQLSNVIQPTPFTPVIGAAVVHCNPANKSIPGAIFPAKNPLAHLLCYQLRYKLAPVTVELANQFGKAVMKTGLSPTALCLPTWKDNLAAPNQPSNQPPGLDHFTCYPLTYLASSYGFKTANVKAEDEFSAPKYVALKLAHADALCVPTTKILPTGATYPPQGANDPSLVCFPTSPTPIWKVVFDQNQFGSSTVYPNSKNEGFCVPSTVSVQGLSAS